MAYKNSQFGANFKFSKPGKPVVVPNLAPSLYDILVASSLGQTVPRVGNPEYDDSIEQGIARSQAAQLAVPELYAAQINGDLAPDKKSGASSEEIESEKKNAASDPEPAKENE